MSALSVVVLLAWIGVTVATFAMLPVVGAAGMSLFAAVVFCFEWRDLTRT